jgi:hypothetical protein
MNEITDQFITKVVNDTQIEMVCISDNKFFLTKVREDVDFSIVEISRGEFLDWISIDEL